MPNCVPTGPYEPQAAAPHCSVDPFDIRTALATTANAVRPAAQAYEERDLLSAIGVLEALLARPGRFRNRWKTGGYRADLALARAQLAALYLRWPDRPAAATPVA